MAELLGKKTALKKLIRTLHASPDRAVEIRSQFRELLEGLTPRLIAEVEEELIEEGVPVHEIQELCDIHLEVFKDAVEQNKPDVPTGHPIQILMEEHTQFLNIMDQLRSIGKTGSLSAEELAVAQRLQSRLEEGERHYLREENVLFPYLEQRGIVQPPAIMWMEHDVIREQKKRLFSSVGSLQLGQPGSALLQAATTLQETLAGHFQKENQILFSTALEVIENELWPRVRGQFDEIGYVFEDPVPMPPCVVQQPVRTLNEVTDAVDLGTGSLTKEQLTWMLNSLPIDITFVDAEDRVRYFSNAMDRIFMRTEAVLGRTVQNCHPQKSVAVVNQIVADFKLGKRDNADFWIRMGERLILIRYFAVRNPQGSYLGTVEVSLDATPIRALEGEKRLYDTSQTAE